nr:MAG TPA: hypothetical protein [Caudoviricetes sp.]
MCLSIFNAPFFHRLSEVSIYIYKLITLKSAVAAYRRIW